ncbi:MAG TPA: helix-turn-helix domain-containing protein [Candidatus Eisenbacteria bacterium]|nr:helix-turn-helix domain-containing protein [Candidatus Eisenbacteria bacterium]
MSRLDLTPFGFTPTESLVYEVLLTGGPGTGYSIARSAGLARANAYSALEGLVSKGAARADAGRPRRFRPEAPMALIARITNDQAAALDRLGDDLGSLSAPASPTLLEIDSPRAALQLLSHEIARVKSSLSLLAPGDAYPVLAPALRRPAAAGLVLKLYSVDEVDLGFAPVEHIGESTVTWPGTPLVAVLDERSAVIAGRSGAEVAGHWSTSPVFVATARAVLGAFGAGGRS